MRLLSRRPLLRKGLINSGTSVVDRCLSFIARGVNAARQPTPVPVRMAVSTVDQIRRRRR
jgi:hypothetical protein